ncbi:MAG: ribonuclease H-like domain-containing protein [Synergistes jonesii]|uniref:ribonuclease H-like domain-containing protein n=1 Tax=Synergistes jonesii TaxID=2754 RepID=UPI002A74D4C9|nr:ribonuclease H-like domain-containing protein [Synergistes jonesii]MDY2985705.1 ribonuclease H-like domain-containing protein [Synergistes jonesii]
MVRPLRNGAEKFSRLEGLLPKGGDGVKREDDLPKELGVGGLPEGEWVARGVYRMERVFEYGRYYGRRQLTSPCASGKILRCWGGDGTPVFLDTETTGLSGGTGTYAFLVGVGVCREDSLHVVQLFLAGPAWEKNWLSALEAELPESCGLVTYNGRAFDLPLLRTRYTLARAVPSWDGAPHMDLLALARHFYKNRLESCSLSSIEKNILGLARSGEDVPGREIPWMYAQFLRSRDARPLRGVFYHNTLDIVSLAALQLHIAELAQGKCACAEDMVLAGDLWQAKGFYENARALWRAALSFKKEGGCALRRLAEAEKAAGNFRTAHEYYEESLAAERCPVASLEALAKMEEHKFRDCAAALAHATEALRWLDNHRIFKDARWEEERRNLLHRIERLKRKLSPRPETDGE